GSTGANPVFNSVAFDRTPTQKLSLQKTRIIEEALGVAPFISAQMKNMAKHLDVDRFKPLNTSENVYELLAGSGLPTTPGGFGHRYLTEAERTELQIGREKFLELEAPIEEIEES